MRILWGEPDDGILHRAEKCLRGAYITRAASTREFANCIRTTFPDVLVTNIALPDGHAHGLVRAVRAAGSAMPMLVYTTDDLCDAQVSMIYALGVEEVVVQIERRWHEFEIRLARLLERSHLDELTVGDLVVSRPRFAIYERGRELTVTSDQFFIVWSLAKGRGGIVEYAEIKADLARHTRRRLTDHALREAVRRLRAWLERPARIQTVQNVGYRLIG